MLLIPVITILVSYRSIAGERELGSMRFLPALPHIRRDVVLGKVLGRTAVVAVAVLAGVAIGGTVIFVWYELSVLVYLGFVAVTMLLGLVHVSVGVGVSAVTGSVARAAGVAVALFVVLRYLWLFVLDLVALPPGDSVPARFDVAAALSPGVAYNELIVSLANRDPASDSIFTGQFDEAVIQLPGRAPLLVFAGWIGLVLAVGYRRFERAGLN